jgi:signal transduction histidine kinase
VRVGLTDGLLRAEVIDAGVGFDAKTSPSSPVAIGLAGMRERADAAGGSLLVQSSLGKGTRLVAEFPVSGHN